MFSLIPRLLLLWTVAELPWGIWITLEGNLESVLFSSERRLIELSALTISCCKISSLSIKTPDCTPKSKFRGIIPRTLHFHALNFVQTVPIPCSVSLGFWWRPLVAFHSPSAIVFGGGLPIVRLAVFLLIINWLSGPGSLRSLFAIVSVELYHVVRLALLIYDFKYLAE